MKKALEGLYSDFMSHQVEQLGFSGGGGGFISFIKSVILKHRHLPQSLCLQTRYGFYFSFGC